jgi:hypothetical protein
MIGSRTPAQVAALVIGAWWTLNGVAALIAEGSNFAVADVHGSASVLGLYDVSVNGWHALFHLLPGLLGLAVAANPEAARSYALGAGAFYVVAAGWGLLAGETSLGVMAVDTFGNIVHAVEGAIVLTAGLVSRRPLPRPAAAA